LITNHSLRLVHVLGAYRPTVKYTQRPDNYIRPSFQYSETCETISTNSDSGPQPGRNDHADVQPTCTSGTCNIMCPRLLY